MYQKFSLISATAVDNFYNHSVYRTVLDLKNPIKGYNLLKSHFNFNVFIFKTTRIQGYSTLVEGILLAGSSNFYAIFETEFWRKCHTPIL